MTADPLVLVIVGGYLLAMLGLGVWVGRTRIEDPDDYLVAGRSMPWYLLAATLAATEVGGGSCMGVTAKAFGPWGLGAAWYIWAMAVTFLLFAWLAPRLVATRCRTIPEFFRQRYGPRAGLFTAVLMLVSLVGLTAVQLMVTGTLMEQMLGVPYVPAVLASGVVVVVYTWFGGMWSVSLTDFVQWACIMIGMVAVLPFALAKGGGWAAVQAALPPEKTHWVASIGWGQILSLVVIYSTSFLVGQEAMQRLYSAKDESHARKGALATSFFYLLFGFLPPVLGLIAFALVEQGAVPAEPFLASGGRHILPLLAAATLPPVLTGVLFAGLLSATMSSADSDLLASASIWSNDLAPGSGESPEEVVSRSRRAVAVVGVLATGVAAADLGPLVDLLKFSFGLRAAGPFVPFLMGHFWARGSRVGAELSLVTATLVVAVLKAGGHEPLGLDATLPGLLVGLVAYLVGSWRWPDPPGERREVGP